MAVANASHLQRPQNSTIAATAATAAAIAIATGPSHRQGNDTTWSIGTRDQIHCASAVIIQQKTAVAAAKYPTHGARNDLRRGISAPTAISRTTTWPQPNENDMPSWSPGAESP